MLRADRDLVGRQAADPVASLYVVAGAQLAKDGLGVVLVDVRVGDETNGIDDRRAIAFRQKRRMLGANVSIRRDVAQERLSKRGRRSKVLDVPAVERIESAVDHRDA